MSGVQANESDAEEFSDDDFYANLPDNEFDLADFSEDEQRRVDEYMHRLHQNSDNESEGGADNDDDDNLPLFLHRRGTQRLDLDWAEDNYRPRANQTEFVQPVGPTRQHNGRMNNPPSAREVGDYIA